MAGERVAPAGGVKNISSRFSAGFFCLSFRGKTILSFLRETKTVIGMASSSGAYIVRVCRCLSLSRWLRKQRLKRSLAVLDPDWGDL